MKTITTIIPKTNVTKHKHINDSWSGFIDSITTLKSRSFVNSSQREYSKYDPEPWAGTHTYGETLELLAKGWQRGLDRIEELRRTLPPTCFDSVMPVEGYKPELRHTVAGGVLDVATYLSGASPETFISEVRNNDEAITGGRQLLSIYCNGATSCHLDEDAFFYRGAYTYLLVEHLEKCGYSVELWHVSSVTVDYVQQDIYTKVKEFGELFDNNKLAIALASSFMLRRLIFKLQESCGVESEYITNYSYGRPNTQNVETMPGDNNALFVNFVNISDKNSAFELFQNTIKEFANRPLGLTA